MQEAMIQQLAERVRAWLGRRELRWFRLLIHRHGEIPLAVRLNFKRKHIPAHPIHWREGMQIRNFLRRQPECAEVSHHDLEDNWRRIVERAVRAEFKGDL
jgi:hypothetical protein